MKINGWAYIIIGAIVAGYSKFIESRTENSIMAFFFYIGLLFCIVGVFKVIFKFITSPKEEESGVGEDFSKAPKNNFPKATSNRRAVICPRCTARLHPQSKYCNWCGYRLKK